MSFALEHIKTVDGHLEQLLLSKLNAAQDSEGSIWLNGQAPSASSDSATGSRAEHLHHLIRSLSTGSSSRPSFEKRSRLLETLKDFESTPTDLSSLDGANYLPEQPTYESELQWFLLAKVANHVYGHALQALISETLPLNNDLWYWTETLSSHRNTALYSAQTSPLRLWHWSHGIYEEVRAKGVSISDGWQQFYGHVRSVVRERSFANVQRRMAAPLAFVTDDIRGKISALRRAKLVNASAIGYLLSNGFNDEELRIDNFVNGNAHAMGDHDKWKATVTRSIAVVDAVLSTIRDPNLEKDMFEESVNLATADDPFSAFADHGSVAEVVKPDDVAERLFDILSRQLPLFTQESHALLRQNSKPSRLIRYWIPASLLFFSGSTLLRILVNRKAEILDWVRELGGTVIDFWRNWVVEPTRKIIGTIRHDEDSEVSIMSKGSLAGDRASLERMVVDFAVDSPGGPSLTDSDIADIRAKVHEGDLTAVLKAYEKDLKSPLYGSVRGNLIRALLIQVQKTKVDVEVAMGGIDSLLKSQELVFGFVGLTPGVLVCFGIFRWLGSFSASQRHIQRGKKQSHSYQILRNVDRILTGSPTSDSGMLSFKEFGLLVCEAIVLRDLALKTFPKETFREFVQDFNDLIDNNSGVGRQIRVADRIRWAYAKWL